MNNKKAALAVALLVTAASCPLTAGAQPHVVIDPGIVVRPVGPLPPALPPATALPPLDGRPEVQNFVAPGLEGIYAELKRDSRTPAPRRLQPYVRYKSLATPADGRYFALNQIVVKFVEGSGVRLRSGALQVTPAASTERARLTRFGIRPTRLQADLQRLARIVADNSGQIGRSAPGIDEVGLERLRLRGQARVGRELPDLNLLYHVYLKEPTPDQARAALRAIQALPSVETAYFQPLPFGAADKAPPTNIDVTSSQGYFGPAPMGIDANYARQFAGGRGNSIRIADIESGWDDSHEDLPAMSFRIGVNWAINEENGSHGTAVLGELVAQENGFGANGLVPNAIVGWSSVTNLDPANIYFYSVGNALLIAGQVLQPGDIALIEQQFVPPTAVAFVCDPALGNCPCTKDAWVAVEEYPAEHAAISVMTAAGIIVVEAAGNGAMQVTPAAAADSGAIVVGAGGSSRDPACWSNFGPRVDVQGWAGGIGSLGYGGFLGTNGIVAVPGLRMNGTDRDQWYTTSFGGTSGASPIVVGAAAIIQATRVDRGLPRLSPAEMRTLLVSTGTPQPTPVVKKIGPLPNLRAALATFIPDAASFVRQTAPPASTVAPSAAFVVTATFKNSGGAFWNGDHTLVVAPSYQTGVQQFQAAPATLGSSSAPIGPGVETTHAFSITAPSQPGTYSLGFLLRNAAGQTLASAPSQTVVVAGPNGTDNANIVIASAPNSMANGATSTVTVNVTNIGTTTWNPTNYLLRLSRFNRVSLPQPSVALPGPVAPNGTVALTFDIVCNGYGTGWFAVTMSGPAGPFGQGPGKTIVCQ